MGLLAFFIRCLAAVMSLFSLRDRVVFLSRQSSSLSLDYRLLIEELETRLPAKSVRVCLAAPETQGAVRFAANMIVQLWFARTSRVCVVDGYNPVVSIPPRREGRTVIQMWHALGAVKKFGLQALDTPSGRSSHEARLGCMHEKYDVIVAAGPGAVRAYAEAFGYEERVVVPTGLPRMDYLRDAAPSSPRIVAARRYGAQFPRLLDNSPKILYAPTFRKGTGDEGWLSRSLEELARELAGTGASLVVTGHPLQKGFDEALLERYGCLCYVPEASTIDLLEFADCVITDYSAVAFEAAILGKQVYFYVPDIEGYRVSPGLNVDPLREFPGLASDDPRDLARKISAGLAGAHDASFAAFAEAYFEGVAYGSASRLADLVCDGLAQRHGKEH